MLTLAVSLMRRRVGSLLGAGAAVGIAAVLIMSCGILLESALKSAVPVERLEGASVVVQADPTMTSGGEAGLTVLLPERPRVDAGLALRLDNLPDVSRAVADRSFDVGIEFLSGDPVGGSADGVTTGHGWSSAALTPYQLDEGRRPTGSTEMVLGQSEASTLAAEVGDRLRVAGPTSQRVYTVVGIASTSAPVTDTQIFFRDDVAEALSGTDDRVDLIGIVTADGVSPAATADRVAEVLPEDLRVLTGDERGEAESHGGAISREDIVAGLTMFGVLAAFVSIFVVASAFALSIHGRHRELALLRAIGTTRGQLRRLVAAEALVLAVAASAVAAPMAVGFAALERWFFVRVGLLPEGVSLTVGWLPFVVGLLAAVLTTQLAARASARRASRVRPTEALRDAAVQPRRTPRVQVLAGLVLAGLGVWVLVDSVAKIDSGGADTAALASAIWMVSAAFLAPVLARPFTALVGIPVRLFGKASGLLARVSTRTNVRRVASVATPVMLTVALAGTVLVSKTTLQQSGEDDSAARTTADLVVRTDDGSPVPRTVSQATSGLEGVEASSGTLTTSVVANDGDNLHLLPALAVDPRTIDRVMDLDVTGGSLTDLRGNTLAVREGARPALGEIGDRVEIHLGDGTPVTLRIAATYARGLGFADVVIPRGLVAGHTTRANDDAVLVRLRDGADPGAVAERIERLDAAPATDLHVLTRAEYLESLADDAAERNVGLYLLLGIVLLFCGLAIVNTLGMAIGQRGEEFALLGLLGASRRQIIRMVRTETMIVVAFGATLGVLVAAPTVAVLSYSLTGDLAPAAPMPLYVGGGATLLLVALMAGSLPARRAVRLHSSGVIERMS
ncbi:ABC transporter permease [Nocardioides bizhenqiangii]|uniref:ABC transporter permease n=1 Tax=Nocardioides bizhenqiangii TaxID=3095076 RepID=A0ABZ0ZRT5_9ACTN|nr:ABC transporter permease [Nocardioides sp. HM61]WQQ26584.1 ABC transporter permease [Nocardioides sp. HM61]